MSITITTDEGRSFPLGSDHAFAAANAHEAILDYIRGERPLEGLDIPPEAFVFEVKHISKGEVRRIRSRVRPRSSGRGLAAVGVIRKAGWDAYKDARRRLAPMGLQAGALAAQNRAMAEALDALSEADYAAHKAQEEHEIAVAVAVAGKAIEQVTVGADGQTVRDLVTAKAPHLNARFDAEAYPIEWVVEHVIAPTWTAQYRKLIAAADARQASAVKVRDEAARKLREAMLAAAGQAVDVEGGADPAEGETSTRRGEAATLTRYMKIWDACRDAQATTQLKSAAGEDFERDDIVNDTLARVQSLLEQQPTAEDDEPPQTTTAADDPLLPLARALIEAFIDLGEAEFAGQWLGEHNTDRVLLEIGRHIMVGTGNPKG